MSGTFHKFVFATIQIIKIIQSKFCPPEVVGRGSETQLQVENKKFYDWEIIINVSINSFYFIWILMLWVYGHYKYFNFSVQGSLLYVCRQQTSDSDL